MMSALIGGKDVVYLGLEDVSSALVYEYREGDERIR